VYFLKLQADYFRYVAEVGSADDRVEKAKTRALNSYNGAIEIADQLAPADPIRLSLYLNFSVYCYEIYDQKDKAIAIAKQGLAEAEDDIENIEKVKASES
jgi:14-3-3 protein epsilon